MRRILKGVWWSWRVFVVVAVTGMQCLWIGASLQAGRWLEPEEVIASAGRLSDWLAHLARF